MMHNFIRKYVWSCSTCVWKKSRHTKKQNVLWFLFIFMQQWWDISIDFIINLSNNNDYMNIMIVIDQLTKIKHIIFLKSLNIIKIAEIFIQNVFKLFDTIISDYKDQFIVIFWKMLCTQLRIEAWLSTAFHSETDNQTENVNIIMKQYLQMYCSYLQDNWKKWFSLVKFIINNIMNKSTSVTLFYVTYEQNSWIRFESQIEIDEHNFMIK